MSTSWMILRGALLTVIGFCCVPNASAEEVWSCTYPNPNGGDAPLVVQYHRNGSILNESPPFPDATHRILNEDRESLVAASGASFINPLTGVLMVEVQAIVINKVRRTSRWIVASEDGSVHLDLHGTCVGG